MTGWQISAFNLELKYVYNTPVTLFSLKRIIDLHSIGRKI